MYKFILLILIIFSHQSFAGSKCPDEWNALKSIQSHLRNNSTEWARSEERRRHKTYQECRKRKNNTLTKTKSYSNKSQETYNQFETLPENKAYRSSISKVNIKGRFKGYKQQAWLDYYRAPARCQSPKNSQQFSKCLQNRDNQAEIFEQVWREHKADYQAR
jgi:hypothetical protein